MPDTPPRIVLDTNVLYAGLYSASGKSYQLLRAIAERRVRIALSSPLLFEYEDVLKLRAMYYNQRGWGENGLPTPATINKLNLKEFVAA